MKVYLLIFNLINKDLCSKFSSHPRIRSTDFWCGSSMRTCAPFHAKFHLCPKDKANCFKNVPHKNVSSKLNK